MTLIQSPSIIMNGLVFLYDQNNRKSYAGPPIQNKCNLLNTAGTGTATGYSSVGGTEIVDIPQLGPTTVYYNIIQNNYSAQSTNCCPNLFSYGSDFSMLSSTLYTYGIVYKVDSGYTGPNFMYRYEYNGGTYVTESGVHDTSKRIYLGDGWWWAWNTFTTQATTTRINYAGLWYYQYSTFTDKVSIAKVIITQGDYTGLHPKYWPAINSTRSNTQSIIDLTSRVTPTANSLTYSTDGTPSFNGTSDYITIGSLPGGFLSFTVLLWIKSSSVQNYRNPIDCNYNYNANSGNIGPRLEQNSSGNLVWVLSGNTTTNSSADSYTVISSGMQANTWYYVGITRNGSTVSTFLNGSIVTNAASNPNSFVGVFNNVVVGKGFSLGGSERVYSGYISNVQIYNRVLSSSEVLQNFNAQRSRFGL